MFAITVANAFNYWTMAIGPLQIVENDNGFEF